MRVSVVVCSHSMDRYGDLGEAVESLFAQTHDPVEIILVSDGSEELCEQLRADYGDHPDVRIACSSENRGLSASRNLGIDVATGDVVAFMDDDAVADERWIENLVAVYEERDVEAVGGKMTPLWMNGKPRHLPEEYYWLVGVTHRGFPEEGPVRNTFGSNISFRADVLEELGGFDETLGRKGDKHLQGEEAELAARLLSDLGGTLYYTPEAKVGHKILEDRTRPPWLLKRAFWQGYSKREMERIIGRQSREESEFLKRLMFEFIPGRVRRLCRDPSTTGLGALTWLILFTAAVGFGYLYGITRPLTRT